MHIDALDRAAGLAGIEVAGVDDVLDREGEIGVGPDIGRVLAAELEAGAGKFGAPATAAMIMRPPAVEPVKPTWSTRPERIARSVVSCDM